MARYQTAGTESAACERTLVVERLNAGNALRRIIAPSFSYQMAKLTNPSGICMLLLTDLMS